MLGRVANARRPGNRIGIEQRQRGQQSRIGPVRSSRGGALIAFERSALAKTTGLPRHQDRLTSESVDQRKNGFPVMKLYSFAK